MKEYVYLLITEYIYDGLDDVQVFKDLEDVISFVQYNYSEYESTMNSINNIELVDDVFYDYFIDNTTKEEKYISIIKKKILQ